MPITSARTAPPSGLPMESASAARACCSGRPIIAASAMAAHKRPNLWSNPLELRILIHLDVMQAAPEPDCRIEAVARRPGVRNASRQ
jgi:hypothetical protein